jgi:hypothetical protein
MSAGRPWWAAPLVLRRLDQRLSIRHPLMVSGLMRT